MKNIVFAICLALSFAGTRTVAASADIYGKLPGIDSIELSPLGTHYAFIAEFKGQRRLVVLESQQDKLVFQTAIPQAKIRGLRWASENNIFLELSDTQNMQATFGTTMEIWNVLWINIKDKKAGFVFNDDPGVADAVFGTYGTALVDGKAYGYFGGIPLRRSTASRAGYDWDPSMKIELYRVNLDDGDVSLEAKSVEDGNHDWVVGPDGRVAATAVYFTKNGAWRVHKGEGRNKPLREITSPIQEIGLSGLGRTIGTFLLIDQTGDVDQLQEVSDTTGEHTVLLEEHSVEGLMFDPVSRLLIGAHVDDDPGAIFFDAEIDRRWRNLEKTFPNLNLRLVSWDQGIKTAVVRSDGLRDSGTFWKVDMAAGTTKVLGHAYPAIRPDRVGSTQMVKYQAQDGLQMEGVLTLPANGQAKNLPLVVMPHGGPIGPSDQIGFDWWAQAYADAGYAVFQPNYRGSGGYGAAFREAGYGEYGGKMQSDIADGVKALVDAGTVDPKRACIVGASYGGYSALYGVTLQQGQYRCAVSVAGVSDVLLMFRWSVNRYGAQSAVTRYRRAVTGAKGGGDSVMEKISPARFAQQADAPILLIHGEDDTVVPIVQSAIMESALKSADKPVEFIRMKGEDHWLSNESTRIEMLTHALDFVKKHNPPN